MRTQRQQIESDIMLLGMTSEKIHSGYNNTIPVMKYDSELRPVKYYALIKDIKKDIGNPWYRLQENLRLHGVASHKEFIYKKLK